VEVSFGAADLIAAEMGEGFACGWFACREQSWFLSWLCWVRV